MKLKRRTRLCLGLGVALGCLALSGYAALASNYASTQTSFPVPETTSDGNEAVSGRDLTVAVENTFNPNAYSKRLYSCGISDSIIGDSLDELSDAAKEIIQGRIISLEYFAFEGRAHTKANVKVEK